MCDSPGASYFIVGTNLVGLVSVYLAVRLRLYTEGMVVFILSVISLCFHGCRVPGWEEMCIGMPAEVWWTMDFTASYSVITLIFVYAVSWDLSPHRWSIYILSVVISTFASLVNASNENMTPWIFLSIGFVFLFSKCVWALYKHSRLDIRSDR